jgi:hypothetical protein
MGFASIVTEEASAKKASFWRSTRRGVRICDLRFAICDLQLNSIANRKSQIANFDQTRNARAEARALIFKIARFTTNYAFCT